MDGQLDEGSAKTINITLAMKRVAHVAAAVSVRETEGVDRQVVCLTQYMWTDRTMRQVVAQLISDHRPSLSRYEKETYKAPKINMYGNTLSDVQDLCHLLTLTVSYFLPRGTHRWPTDWPTDRLREWPAADIMNFCKEGKEGRNRGRTSSTGSPRNHHMVMFCFTADCSNNKLRPQHYQGVGTSWELWSSQLNAAAADMRRTGTHTGR